MPNSKSQAETKTQQRTKSRSAVRQAAITLNPMLSVGLLKQVFEAAGFQFIKHHPIGRLVFYSPMDERDIQLWYKPKINIDQKNSLERAMDLICQLAYERGESWGKHTVRTGIKKSLGLS